MRLLENSRSVNHTIKEIEVLLSKVKQQMGNLEGDVVTLAGALGVRQAKVTWNRNWKNPTYNGNNHTATTHTGSPALTDTITHPKTKAAKRGTYGGSTNMTALQNLLSSGQTIDAARVAYNLGIKPSYARVLLGLATKQGYAKRTAPGKYTKN